jgi:hypothetical protein
MAVPCIPCGPANIMHPTPTAAECATRSWLLHAGICPLHAAAPTCCHAQLDAAVEHWVRVAW